MLQFAYLLKIVETATENKFSNATTFSYYHKAKLTKETLLRSYMA